MSSVETGVYIGIAAAPGLADDPSVALMDEQRAHEVDLLSPQIAALIPPQRVSLSKGLKGSCCTLSTKKWTYLAL